MTANIAPTEMFERIQLLEAELARAEGDLIRQQAISPVAGCGSPEHDRAADRISALEAELAQFSTRAGDRRKAYLERIGKQRQARLTAEVARLIDEVARARPLAMGRPELLTELKQLREQRSLLETRHGSLDQGARELASARELAKAEPPMVWVPDPRDRMLSRSELSKIGLLTMAAMPLLDATLALFMTLAAAIIAMRVGLFGARRDRELVSADMIYGSSWKDVGQITFVSPNRLIIDVGRRSHRFDTRMPAFRQVIRHALEAAALYSLPVVGEVPSQLQLPEPRTRAKRPTR